MFGTLQERRKNVDDKIVVKWPIMGANGDVDLCYELFESCGTQNLELWDKIPDIQNRFRIRSKTYCKLTLYGIKISTGQYETSESREYRTF